MPAIRNRQAELTGPDCTTVAKYSITYKDVFNLEQLYVLMHEWAIDLGFAKRDKDPDFPEVHYLLRDHPQLGKEMWIRWRLTRADGKLYLGILDIDTHILGLKDVEVLIQGKKVKANKGEVEVQVQAVVKGDPDGKWEAHPFLKHVKRVILYRVLSNKFTVAKAKLQANAYDLQAAIKTYLKLPLYKAEPEARMYWPKKDTG